MTRTRRDACRTLLFGAAASGFALALPARTARAAPSAELWPRWTTHDAGSRRQVDHAAWDRFLDRYRKAGTGGGPSRLAYAAVTADDKAALRAYLELLANTPVSTLNQVEQFAYWANLYNALTVRVILDHYPVASIRDIDISPGWFSSGPWGAKLITVEGEQVSLDDVEHRILRPIWQDPRIHYAVNCASIGCPDLLAKAFRAATLDADLTAAARAYVNSPRGAMRTADGLVVSRIYDWFQADFGGTRAGVLAHLRQHAAEPLARAIDAGVRITGFAYDWGLNDARTVG